MSEVSCRVHKEEKEYWIRKYRRYDFNGFNIAGDNKEALKDEEGGRSKTSKNERKEATERDEEKEREVREFASQAVEGSKWKSHGKSMPPNQKQPQQLSISTFVLVTTLIVIVIWIISSEWP